MCQRTYSRIIDFAQGGAADDNIILALKNNERKPTIENI